MEEKLDKLPKGLEVEGILSPVHHLGVTDVIWWHKGEASVSVQRFTSESLICNKPSNFSINQEGFKIRGDL